MNTTDELIPLCTPGEFLREEFLEPFGLTVYQLAKRLRVPSRRIQAIVKGGRAINPDTALRLERAFGLSEGYFLRLQIDYDLRLAKRELSARIEAEVTPFPTPSLG